MIRSVPGLDDLGRAGENAPSVLAWAVHCSEQEREKVEAGRHIRMIRPEGLFENRQRAAMNQLRLVEAVHG